MIAAFLFISACAEDLPEPSATESPPTSFLPPGPPLEAGCGAGGFLEGELYGALQGQLDWRGDAIDCQGMPRPENRGARLRFAGNIANNAVSIAIIVAVPELERAATATGLASNVTLIEEGSGRFFSTQNGDSCWTDVDRQQVDDNGKFVVDGKLYCIAPLVQINGEANVSIPELRFSGLIDWGDS